jgi:hypothetical protein
MQLSNDVMRTIRIARDFLIGFALFMLICSVHLAGTGSPAPLVFLNAVRTSIFATAVELGAWQPAGAAFDVLSCLPIAHDRELVILGLVFSGMVAFNLWFARHLHRDYVSTRTDTRTRCR